MMMFFHKFTGMWLVQSYEVKLPPWTIWWFRILGIFSIVNINRLGAMLFQTSDNSQLCIDSQYSSRQLTILWSLIHHSTQPILIFFRVRVLHLDRLKEGTWLHSFESVKWQLLGYCLHLSRFQVKCCKKFARLKLGYDPFLSSPDGWIF